MTSPLRLGIAGLGTVGSGVVRIVQRHAALLAARAGRDVVITAVSARSRDKDRGLRLGDYAWEDDPVALAQRDDVDVFIELIGGESGGRGGAGHRQGRSDGQQGVVGPSWSTTC